MSACVPDGRSEYFLGIVQLKLCLKVKNLHSSSEKEPQLKVLRKRVDRSSKFFLGVGGIERWRALKQKVEIRFYANELHGGFLSSNSVTDQLVVSKTRNVCFFLKPFLQKP